MRELKRIWTGLLALCLALAGAVPVFADAAAADGGITGSGGGSSTIAIEIWKKQPAQVTLTIQVVDKASGAGIPSVRVELRDPDHPDTPPITGSPLGVHETDGSGRIEIKLFSDPEKRYQIVVNHLGYDPYAGDIFTVEKDTYKRVELVKEGGGGGGGGSKIWVYYHAGAGGSLDGADRERVPYNGSPREVPSPVADKGYDFAGWMLQGRFVEPGELKVRKTIDLYAVFERRPDPVPPAPVPTPPVPSPAPTPPSITPSAPGSDASVKPKPSRPRPSKRPGPGADSAIRHDGSESGADSGLAASGGPSLETGGPDYGPSVPAFGPALEEPEAGGKRDHKCFIHWWILLCAALTAVLGILRLRAIKKRLEKQERQAQKEGK